MSNPFPLPVLWRAPLDWFYIDAQAPHLGDGEITVRCGERIASFNSSDGSAIWNLAIQDGAGDGSFFLAHAGRYFTDFVRRPERLSGVAAFSAHGAILWKVPLPAIMAPGAGAIVGNHLFCIANEPGAGVRVYRIDLIDGVQEPPLSSSWGANGLVLLSNGTLLVRNQITESGSPGLYTMHRDGRDPQPIASDSTWRLERRAHRILTVTRTTTDKPRRLHMYAEPSLAELWTAGSVNEAVAYDGEHVFHTESQDNQVHLIARHGENGKVRWQTGPLSQAVVRIQAAGPVVLCAHFGGAVLYRSDDGSQIGSVTGSYRHPLYRDDKLYIASEQALLCARSSV